MKMYLKYLSIIKMITMIIILTFFLRICYIPVNCYCMYCKKLTHPKNTCLKCGKYRLVDDYEIINLELNEME